MAENDKIKLEDLLKLKRAERPDSADWKRFDEELKNKLYFRIVKRPSLFHRILDAIPAKPFAFAGATGAAFALAFFLPADSEMTGADFTASQAELQSLEISKTPLPVVEASYAVNVIPADLYKAETPVFAQMNVDGDSVRYVSTALEGSGSFIF